MCGINGIISRKELDKKVIQKMNNSILHRGPDEGGIITYSDKNHGINLGMGMRRLSIIDLKSGSQPMYSVCRRFVITYNGEIYNYRQLQKLLEQNSINCCTSSDTEVIVNLFSVMGPSSFELLDGMFALAIYDTLEKKIYLARDFFGEKPLYYTNNDDRIIWSSELKGITSILKKEDLSISKEALQKFFQLQFIPAPITIFNEVLKVNRNTCIEISLNNFSIKEKRIHHINRNEKNITISFNEAKEIIRSKVLESIKSRSVSDVGYSSFLSGGIDSGIVTFGLSLLKTDPVNTYTISFSKNSYDESKQAQKLSNHFNTNHKSILFSESYIHEQLSNIVLSYDEPFADSSMIPTYFLAEMVRNEGKVFLSGDGGDEIFGGYNKYLIRDINKRYTSVVPEKIHNILKKNLFALKSDDRGFFYKVKKTVECMDYSGQEYFNILSQGFKSWELNRLLKDTTNLNISSLNPMKNHPKTFFDFREIDFDLSLEGGLLPKMDRASMANSIETRSPFLNVDLLKFTNSLPLNFLINKDQKKLLLKEAFKNDFPKGYFNFPKKGFGSPVGDYLKLEPFYSMLKEYSSNEFLEKQGLFNVEYIQKLIEAHNTGNDQSSKIWTFYCFQVWYTKFFKSNNLNNSFLSN